MKSISLVATLFALSSLISSCSLLKPKKTHSVVQDSEVQAETEMVKQLPNKQKVVIIPTTEAAVKVEKEEMITRAPASIKTKKTTGNIVYTPLWIEIPVSECLEMVKNPNYKNGACIKRLP